MSEILENRRKWIEFLKRPETKKYTSRLASITIPGARCCLGHGCEALGLQYRPSGLLATEEFIEAVGLWSKDGTAKDNGNVFAIKGYRSLASLNDHTVYTPQQIGEYLESVIMGGEDTPFKPIKE